MNIIYFYGTMYYKEVVLVEFLDILDKQGNKTGEKKERKFIVKAIGIREFIYG